MKDAPGLLDDFPRWAKVLGAITIAVMVVVVLWLMFLALYVATKWVF